LTALLALLVAVAPVGESRQVLILADGAARAYVIPGPLIVERSESVFVAGVLADPAGYTLDYRRGELRFAKALPAWTPVTVTYRCVRFSGLREEYGRQAEGSGLRPEERGPVQASEQTAVRVDTVAWWAAPELGLSGSKTVGVSAGTGGIGLSQATRLGLSGEVEGVVIDAELSDQSSPIPPEGVTRDLQELDRISIGARGRRWQGTFGDVDLSIPAGRFGNLSRRAVGALVEAALPKSGSDTLLRVRAAYARPRGQYGRVRLDGIDGMQGPYVLAPDGRSAQVVPASEEVYLDGTRMTRGWDEDYTIDYSTGELVFTSRRVIARRSRVEAEFQYATDAYERTIAGATATAAPGPAELGVGVFREGDDPQRRIAEELSDEQRAYLAGIGADTGRAWLPGAQRVGQGRGDYVRDGDHYRYVGRDSGDHTVRFTLKGDSSGAYIYDPLLLYYRYVGPDAGNYVDSFRAVLPGRLDAACGSAGFRLRGFSGRAEGAFLRRSLNLLAPGGAAADAPAGAAEAGWADSLYSVRFKYMTQAPGFSLPGQRSDRDFAYRWAGATEEERQSSGEAALEARPWRHARLSMDAGRLYRFCGPPVDRLAGGARVGWLSAELSRVGERTLAGVALAPVVRWFRPGAGWQQEVWSDRRDRVVRLSAAGVPREELSAGLEYRLTDADSADSTTGTWTPRSRAQLLQTSVSLSLHDALRGEASGGGHRVVRLPAGGVDLDQLTGRAMLTFAPRPGVRMQADAAQSYRRMQLRDEQFRYVGPHQGEYRLDTLTGRYVFDPEGEYERVVVATGRFAAAREQTASATADIALFDPAVLSGSVSRSTTVADSGLLAEATRYDARLTLRAAEPLLSVFVKASGDVGADRTLAVTGKSTSRYQEYLELASERLPWADLRARVERQDARRMSGSAGPEYEESGWRLEVWPILGKALRLELTLAGEVAMIAEPTAYPELGRFQLRTIEAGLARSLVIGKALRLRLNAGVVERSSQVRSLPFDIGLTRPLGLTASAGAELEQVLNELLTLSGRYRFSDRPDRLPEHDAGVELRAFF
jgi:hypothetical protein